VDLLGITVDKIGYGSIISLTTFYFYLFHINT